MKLLLIIFSIILINFQAQANHDISYSCSGYEFNGEKKQIKFTIDYLDWTENNKYQQETLTIISDDPSTERVIELSYLRKMSKQYKCANLNEVNSGEHSQQFFLYKYLCGPFNDYIISGQCMLNNN